MAAITLVEPADHVTVFTDCADAAFGPFAEEAEAGLEEVLGVESEGVCRPSMR